MGPQIKDLFTQTILYVCSRILLFQSAAAARNSSSEFEFGVPIGLEKFGVPSPFLSIFGFRSLIIISITVPALITAARGGRPNGGVLGSLAETVSSYSARLAVFARNSTSSNLTKKIRGSFSLNVPRRLYCDITWIDYDKI
jgi:hypothetical protein